MEYFSGKHNLCSFYSESPKSTIEAGKQLAEKLDEGSIVCLHGELGAGKTTLVKGIAEGLDISEEIISPSYLLLREYRGRVPLVHIDLFRINSDQEAIEIGLDDYLIGPDGVVVIEWAERIKDILPDDRVVIRLEYVNGNKRKITSNLPFESW